MRRELGQTKQQPPRLWRRHGLDVAGVCGQKQRLAAAERMLPHKPLTDRREHGASFVAKVCHSGLATRIHVRVEADEIFDLRFGTVVEGFIGSPHVRKLDVAAPRHNRATG